MAVVGPSDYFFSFVHRMAPPCLERFGANLFGRASGNIPEIDVSVYSFESASAEKFSGKIFQGLPPGSLVDCSLVITVLNEENSVSEWFNSFGAQSVLPKEVVITDGGSSDSTVTRIKFEISQLQSQPNFSEISFKVLQLKNASIAYGRNQAIGAASYDLIAVTDLGCRLDAYWLERIVFPLLVDPETDFSMGHYRAEATSFWSKMYSHFLIRDIDPGDLTTFLPSARSQAFRKSLWVQAGWFPDYLTFAGEDSLFALHCRSFARKTAFTPDAIVHWTMPKSFPKLFRMVFRYARGDAEGGRLFGEQYLSTLQFFIAILLELSAGWLLLLGPWWLSLPGWVFIGFGLIRLFCAVDRYSPFSSLVETDIKHVAGRFTAGLGMFAAQSLGFLWGLLGRRKVEKRRLAGEAREHHLVSVQSSSVETLEGAKDYVSEQLLSGQIVTVLEPETASLGLDHPRLQSFKKTHFVEGVWKEKFIDKAEQDTVLKKDFRAKPSQGSEQF